jgi:hypothetical protein
MKHTFLAIKPQRLPVVGDLIRSDNTPNFVNLVLDVKRLSEDSAEVRSVRYGDTNKGDFKPLAGRRSRQIVFPRADDVRGRWSVVEEYVPLDNAKFRAELVKSLEGVSTSWAAISERSFDGPG